MKQTTAYIIALASLILTLILSGSGILHAHDRMRAESPESTPQNGVVHILT